MSRKTPKFWIVYTAAWFPYAASYFALSIEQSAVSISAGILRTIINITPAALLGLAVLQICERFPWTRRRRLWFFPAHLGFATAYGLLWFFAVMLIITFEQSLIAKKWMPAAYMKLAIYWTLMLGLMIYGTIASVAYAYQVTAHLRREQERAEQAEALRTKAELKALRSQLNPHFLFNTLHSLMALVRHDPQAAEDALERFADMFRYALKADREEKTADDDVSFNAEWNFVQNYLALEQIRLGDRLRVETNIAPDSLDCALPAFTLQPLVENAIKHAVAPHMRTGTVTITSRIESKEVVIEVRDDGPGTTRAALEASSGLGLHAVRQRLELRYAGQAQFTFDSAPNRGVAVSIRVPVEDSIEARRK